MKAQPLHAAGQQMDKKEERKAFDAVFRDLPVTVSEGEEPDFVCSQNGVPCFGVEVTRFFWTESDARLQNIRGYASDLIAGGEYRHKDDITEIRVEDVVYHSVSTGRSIPLKAIGRQIPLLHASVPKLLGAIAGKNAKVVKYHQRVDPVDLIIADVQSVCRFNTIQDILELIVVSAGSAAIYDSPFREVYLIARCHYKGTVYVPLRANLLLSEVALFADAFRAFRKELGVSATLGDYLEHLGAHLVTRFPGVMYYNDPVGGARFVFGSISWGLTPEQQIQLTDISRENTAGWMPVAPDIEPDTLPNRLKEMIHERRSTQLFAYEFYLEARVTADAPDQT
jgi:hypothetical protein